jgi:hypothetical protein
MKCIVDRNINVWECDILWIGFALRDFFLDFWGIAF